MQTIFFYGSLRDRDLLEIVVGRPVAEADFVPASAPDHAAYRLETEAYPALVPAPGQRAEGVLFRNAGAGDIERLTYFEEAEYGLAPIAVTTAGGNHEALYFRGTEKPRVSRIPWDFGRWRRDHRAIAIEAAREYMDYMGRIPVEQIDTVWSGIMVRAYQRARAAAQGPATGAIRSDFGESGLEVLDLSRNPTPFLSIEEMRLRHRRFDGGWTGPLVRSVVRWGDAVSVLPYDPLRDRVLLIEQFRPGPAARGDRNPWCIEAIAGRIDTPEGAEQTARREAQEEAGLTLGRLEPVAGFYPSPGVAAEHLTVYVGEADLPGPGGLHGLAGEGEDIRSMVLSLDEAMAAVGAGAVNTATALIPLLWLPANRARLRAAWAPAA